MSRMKNALSIDLEDWFCVHNLAGVIKRDDWDKCDLRVRRNTTRILDLLDEKKVNATFFVTGWRADRCPDLIQEVERRGHEIGVHGYNHLLLTEITPEEFDADLQKAFEALDRAGVKSNPIGFRAPSFSMVNTTKDWALPTLEKYGFRYDSSVFPVGFHPDYGIANAPLSPYKITDRLYEFPMSVLEIYGRRFPSCGGGYFRPFPYSYTRYCMRKVNEQGRAVVFYLHPWELDPGQPCINNLSASQKFRHYRNLDQTERPLRRLVNDFQFTTVREVLQI